MCHQYGISALVSQTSFHGETISDVMKMSAVFSGTEKTKWSFKKTYDTQPLKFKKRIIHWLTELFLEKNLPQNTKSKSFLKLIFYLA